MVFVFICRDPAFLHYLDKIGQHFFGVPPPRRAAPGGMFSGIFDSLMNAFNDDDDDREPDIGQAGSSATAQPQLPSTSRKMATEDLD